MLRKLKKSVTCFKKSMNLPSRWLFAFISDRVLLERGLSLTELSERVGITIANLSVLKTGKAKAVRFSTLEAICKTLDCQPGDLFTFEKTAEEIES